MLQHCIVCTYENYFIICFFILLNDRYSEVMFAKYGGSRINDACTVCLADFVGLPAKSHMADCILFKKEK